MSKKTLSDLFVTQLRDMYFAEKKIYKNLRKMSKATELPQLKQAFDDHREQTHEQISRIEQVFELLGKRAQPKTCDAINGLIEDGEDTIDDYGDSPVIDTALVAASTAIEHYEIARYGSLIVWAKQLGIDEAAKLLDANLQEEITAEHLLIQIAQTYADKAADVPNEAGKDPDAEKAADKPVA